MFLLEKLNTNGWWPEDLEIFEALHRRLVDAGWSSKSLPELPKKRYLLQSLEGSFVEARRRLLDNYLGALLGDDLIL